MSFKRGSTVLADPVSCWVSSPQGTHSPAPPARASQSQPGSREVDPSEYEPQVVVLEEESSDHTPDHTQEDVADSSELGGSGGPTGKAQVMKSSPCVWK